MPDFKLLCLLLSSVDQKQILLLRFMELQVEFLRERVKERLLPDEAEKAALARLAAEIGRPELKDHVSLFHVETLFKWHKELVSQKYDGSKKRGPGRPSPWIFLKAKVLQIAQENPGWGAPRIYGQLSKLGYGVKRSTVRRLMQGLGLDPNPPKSRRWADFLERNKAAIVASDFFSVEALTAKGLTTYYCLFFIQHDTRKIHLAGVTEHPDEAWMTQCARNLTMEGEEFFKGRKYLILDRDTKFCKSFREIFKGQGVETLILPKESPNLNAIAERWIRSVREECLNELLFLPTEETLRRVLAQYLEHFHHERPHQGLGNTIPFPLCPTPQAPPVNGRLQCKSRLGGLLNYYYWEGGNEEKSAA